MAQERSFCPVLQAPCREHECRWFREGNCSVICAALDAQDIDGKLSDMLVELCKLTGNRERLRAMNEHVSGEEIHEILYSQGIDPRVSPNGQPVHVHIHLPVDAAGQPAGQPLTERQGATIP